MKRDLAALLALIVFTIFAIAGGFSINATGGLFGIAGAALVWSLILGAAE